MSTLLKEVITENTGIRIDQCYQCGKCSAGCPLSEEMDYPPSYLIRMLQTGNADLEEKVLRSFTIWVCLSCETCYSRCPMSIEIPKIMDFLRERSLVEHKSNRKAKKIIAFHRSFLKSIERTGRLYELGMLADYKLHTADLMQDMDLAPKMLAAGKLNIFPELIHDRANLSAVFSKTIKKKK
jgi:heterodisulfide reductase subunit C